MTKTINTPSARTQAAAQATGAWYISICPETGRRFMCEAGRDGNLAELFCDARQAHLITIAPKLLAALIDLLGDMPSVQNGICHHCGRDYTGEDMPDGDCPSDDCPSFLAREAIADAADLTGRVA